MPSTWDDYVWPSYAKAWPDCLRLKNPHAPLAKQLSHVALTAQIPQLVSGFAQAWVCSANACAPAAPAFTSMSTLPLVLSVWHSCISGVTHCQQSWELAHFMIEQTSVIHKGSVSSQLAVHPISTLCDRKGLLWSEIGCCEKTKTSKEATANYKEHVAKL